MKRIELTDEECKRVCDALEWFPALENRTLARRIKMAPVCGPDGEATPPTGNVPP